MGWLHMPIFPVYVVIAAVDVLVCASATVDEVARTITRQPFEIMMARPFGDCRSAMVCSTEIWAWLSISSQQRRRHALVSYYHRLHSYFRSTMRADVLGALLAISFGAELSQPTILRRSFQSR